MEILKKILSYYTTHKLPIVLGGVMIAMGIIGLIIGMDLLDFETFLKIAPLIIPVGLLAGVIEVFFGLSTGSEYYCGGYNIYHHWLWQMFLLLHLTELSDMNFPKGVDMLRLSPSNG